MYVARFSVANLNSIPEKKGSRCLFGNGRNSAFSVSVESYFDLLSDPMVWIVTKRFDESSEVGVV